MAPVKQRGCLHIPLMIWRRLLTVGLAAWGLIFPCLFHTTAAPAAAQTAAAPCDIIDGFDWPVPGIDTQRTDFAIYRNNFGGMHTGIDVAFEQLGDPVRAAARGRVTYSDPAGWDTEKGVVVIQHTLPDGSLVNTLYGHMEELNGYTFPAVDQCVERGDIIGAVGFPSWGRPHLHYEVRTRYRYEGGPGYTTVSPLELGWLNPVDFTYLANVWVQPAFRDHLALLENPTVPPLRLSDGTYVIAHSQHIQGLTEAGEVLWGFDTLGSVASLIALPDGRVLVPDSNGQALVLQNGVYSALWQTPAFLTPPVVVAGLVVFFAEDGTLAAFTPDGHPVWTTPPLAGRVVRWAVSGDQLAVATDQNQLSIVEAGGQVLLQTEYPALPVPCAASGGGFLLLTGTRVWRLDAASEPVLVIDTGRDFTANAELLETADGTLYLYTGDGRALYAYAPGTDPARGPQWIAFMPGSFRRGPELQVGGGRLVYVLTTDGQLLAYASEDGHLVGQLALYDGGIDGSTAARWLEVQPDDTVRFGAGYLSIVVLDGLALLPEGG